MTPTPEALARRDALLAIEIPGAPPELRHYYYQTFEDEHFWYLTTHKGRLELVPKRPLPARLGVTRQ